MNLQAKVKAKSHCLYMYVIVIVSLYITWRLVNDLYCVGVECRLSVQFQHFGLFEGNLSWTTETRYTEEGTDKPVVCRLLCSLHEGGLGGIIKVKPWRSTHCCRRRVCRVVTRSCIDRGVLGCEKDKRTPSRRRPASAPPCDASFGARSWTGRWQRCSGPSWCSRDVAERPSRRERRWRWTCRRSATRTAIDPLSPAADPQWTTAIQTLQTADWRFPLPLYATTSAYSVLWSYVIWSHMRNCSYGRPKECLYTLLLCFSLASLSASSPRSPHQKYITCWVVGGT